MVFSAKDMPQKKSVPDSAVLGQIGSRQSRKERSGVFRDGLEGGNPGGSLVQREVKAS